MVKVKPSKGMAFVVVFFTQLFIIPAGFIIALLTRRKDKYVMYYAKQSLTIYVAFLVWWVAFFLINWLIWAILGLLLVVLWIITLINTLSGKTKPLPMLQWLADKFKF